MKCNRPTSAVTMGGWLYFRCSDLMRARVVARSRDEEFSVADAVTMVERWVADYGDDEALLPDPEWGLMALAVGELMTRLMDRAPMTSEERTLARKLTKTALFASGAMTA